MHTKLSSLSLVIMLSACIAGAAPAPYPIAVNSRAQSAPAVTCYRANKFTIRATYLDGQTASDLTGAIPFLSWATNTTAASVSTSSWAFVGSPTNGIVDFTFAPEAVNFTPGRYIYEVGVKTSNSVVSVYRQGLFFLVGSPTAAGVGAVDWTTSLNWDLIDWTNLPDYISVESDPIAYPVATNALATATNALAVAEGALQAEADTLATVTERGATTLQTIGVGGLEIGAGTAVAGQRSIAIGGGSLASGYESFAHGGESIAVGVNSHAQGSYSIAYGISSFAGGDSSSATGNYSRATGYNAVALDDYSSVWQGSVGGGMEPSYTSHGPGTFNINPVGGLAGLWIGETNMATTLSGYATAGAVATVQAEVGAGTNWLTRTGLSGTVAFANDAGRPQAWSGTGALTVSGFTGLTPPTQVYWTMSGFSSVTLPAGVYAVGGGSWQTNAVNHFTLWAVGTNTMMSFITTTPIED